MRPLIQRTAMAVTALAVALSCQHADAAPTIGQAAPPLVAKELDGHAFDLAMLRGDPVIVSFWATWCVPCRTEMPILDKFNRDHHAQGLEMIAVSADRPRDRGDVEKVMQAYAYPAAMLRDAKENGFGAPQALPITYVIDAGGVVRAQFRPDETGVTAQQLDSVVLPLLSHSR